MFNVLKNNSDDHQSFEIFFFMETSLKYTVYTTNKLVQTQKDLLQQAVLRCLIDSHIYQLHNK